MSNCSRVVAVGLGIGCAVMRRRSANGWYGIWQRSTTCRQHPTTPARRRRAGSARYRWCAIAAPTTRCRPFADRLLVTAQPIPEPTATTLEQLLVQRREARRPWHRHQQVPADPADQSLDLAL